MCSLTSWFITMCISDHSYHLLFLPVYSAHGHNDKLRLTSLVMCPQTLCMSSQSCNYLPWSTNTRVLPWGPEVLTDILNISLHTEKHRMVFTYVNRGSSMFCRNQLFPQTWRSTVLIIITPSLSRMSLKQQKECSWGVPAAVIQDMNKQLTIMAGSWLWELICVRIYFWWQRIKFSDNPSSWQLKGWEWKKARSSAIHLIVRTAPTWRWYGRAAGVCLPVDSICHTR